MIDFTSLSKALVAADLFARAACMSYEKTMSLLRAMMKGHMNETKTPPAPTARETVCQYCKAPLVDRAVSFAGRVAVRLPEHQERGKDGRALLQDFDPAREANHYPTCPARPHKVKVRYV